MIRRTQFYKMILEIFAWAATIAEDHCMHRQLKGTNRSLSRCCILSWPIKPGWLRAILRIATDFTVCDFHSALQRLTIAMPGSMFMSRLIGLAAQQERPTPDLSKIHSRFAHTRQSAYPTSLSDSKEKLDVWGNL